MEIAVAILFVCLAVGFIFFRLANARKEAEQLRGGPETEDATLAVEAPLPGRERLGTRVRALLSRDAGEDAWRALHDILLKADVGPTAASELVERVRARWSRDTDPPKRCFGRRWFRSWVRISDCRCRTRA